MNIQAILSVIAGAMVFGGIGLGIYGLIPRPAPPPRHTRRTAWPGWLTRMPGWQRIAAAVALVAGIALAVTTGWVILVAVLPLAVVGLPLVLATSDAGPRIARLDGIAEWTRSLAGVLTAGQGLEQALQASLRSTPDVIRPEVAQLIGRLRARWSTENALRAFADDLDDATGDLVVAALILGSRKRGDGLAKVLNGLSESVAEDVRSRRQLEADRAKPRSTARTVTAISLAALLVLALTGQFLAPYATPVGQLLLAVFLAGYTGCAVWLRRLSATPAPERFIARRPVAP